MSTRADNRETLAIRAALAAFSETLNRELEQLDQADLAELDATKHRHVSVLFGVKKPIVAVTTVTFTSDVEAVRYVLAVTKKEGTG
jgi:hypothetical protein